MTDVHEDKVIRSNSDVICELSCERREISTKLGELKKVITAAPQSVSEHHKDLWKRQVKAMQDYIDVLGERIKDLIDSGT